MNNRQAVDGNSSSRNGGEQRPVYQPSVDILDTPSDVVLVADVPGVDESHLDVTLDKNVLTIRGTVQHASFEGYTPLRTEYGVGDFERVFTVSDDVNRDGIEATVKDGVLQLKLPKTAQSARRKINVVAR
jgi:HSP20 family molecular chaperone IbpA